MTFIDGDRVGFYGTADLELDNLTGTVIGQVTKDHYGAHYIVLLDKPYSQYPWRSIAITEHCIKHLGE